MNCPLPDVLLRTEASALDTFGPPLAGAGALDELAARQRRRAAVIDHTLQAAILILSAAAIWLVAQPQPAQAWGFALGLASQPAWFAATWRKRQWGMFALSIFYTGAWVLGLVNHF